MALSCIRYTIQVNKATLAPSSRIVAFDLLRGCFLLVVIIDHVELFPSGYDFVSGRGQLWVSAAEGFFFLSGLLVGVVYRKKIQLSADEGGGIQLAFRKLWSRALLLYICSVSLTLLFTAWALAHGNAESIKYAAATHLGWDTVWQTLQLKYVYGWSDFLSYYVTFMLAAPFILYLFKKKLWWLVVGLSAFIWLNRGFNFNQAWQVLFFGGMLAGYYWRNLQARVADWSERLRTRAYRTIVGAAGVTLAISFLNLFLLDNLHNKLDTLSPGVASFIYHWDRINESFWPYFDKFTLEPGRMLMFLLWFAGAFLVVNRYAHKIPKKIAWGLNLFGQNSLYVYGFHSILVFIVHAYLPKTNGLVFNFLVTSLVIAIMLAITYANVKRKQHEVANGSSFIEQLRLIPHTIKGRGKL